MPPLREEAIRTGLRELAEKILQVEIRQGGKIVEDHGSVRGSGFADKVLSRYCNIFGMVHSL